MEKGEKKVKTARKSTPVSGELLVTGMAGLDGLLGGGLPRGGLVEIWGMPSSGRTGLMFSILAQAISRGEVAAYIDTFGGLDPVFARKSGIDLSHLLWIQCGASLSKALKAADIVASAGGFGVLALDLESPDGEAVKSLKRIPFSTWHRLRRTVEGTPSVILILCREPVAGSAARISMALQNLERHWEALPGSTSRPRRAYYLGGLLSQVRLHRGRRQGSVTFHCTF